MINFKYFQFYLPEENVPSWLMELKPSVHDAVIFKIPVIVFGGFVVVFRKSEDYFIVKLLGNCAIKIPNSSAGFNLISKSPNGKGYTKIIGKLCGIFNGKK